MQVLQHAKNAIGWNAMKMLKMHQNALKCTRMRMGKNYTTFGKKLQQSRCGAARHHALSANSWRT